MPNCYGLFLDSPLLVILRNGVKINCQSYLIPFHSNCPSFCFVLIRWLGVIVWVQSKKIVIWAKTNLPKFSTLCWHRSLLIISLLGCSLIGAPSSGHPEHRKICVIIKIYYAFLSVNELVDSIFINFFCKKNLWKYYQLIYSRATTYAYLCSTIYTILRNVYFRNPTGRNWCLGCTRRL